jgi:hypothetical protein
MASSADWVQLWLLSYPEEEQLNAAPRRMTCEVMEPVAMPSQMTTVRRTTAARPRRFSGE